MLKDITLGQYFPGNSFVHRLDPRCKLIMVVVYIVALFLAGNLVSYGICLLFLAASIYVSQIPLKAITSGMKPLLMILIFTGILNLFFTTEGPTTELEACPATKASVSLSVGLGKPAIPPYCRRRAKSAWRPVSIL